MEDDDDVRQARVAFLIAPAAAGTSTGPDSATCLDALFAQLLRAYRKAGAAAADGALLRLMRGVLRAPLAAALAEKPLSELPAEPDLGAQLLPLMRDAGVAEEKEAAAAAVKKIGGVGPAELALAAKDVGPQAALARGPLGLEPGAAAVVTNGRSIVDWSPRHDAAGAGGGGLEGLTAEDFALMQMYAFDIQPGEHEWGEGAQGPSWFGGGWRGPRLAAGARQGTSVSADIFERKPPRCASRRGPHQHPQARGQELPGAPADERRAAGGRQRGGGAGVPGLQVGGGRLGTGGG